MVRLPLADTHWFMRAAPILSFLVLPLLLAGCGPDAGIAAGVAVGGIAIFHRTPVDMVVSAVSGRDCSVVYLDRGERYCRPKERPPETPVFCTRSLGVPDCWENPARLPNNPKEIADGPRSLTPEQESDRTRRGLGFW
jgi:hypothetical protein